MLDFPNLLLGFMGVFLVINGIFVAVFGDEPIEDNPKAILLAIINLITLIVFMALILNNFPSIQF